MRNVEAGLGRGEGGSERIREDPRGLNPRNARERVIKGREDRGARGNSGLSRVSAQASRILSDPPSPRPIPLEDFAADDVLHVGFPKLQDPPPLDPPSE